MLSGDNRAGDCQDALRVWHGGVRRPQGGRIALGHQNRNVEDVSRTGYRGSIRLRRGGDVIQLK